VPQQVAGLLEGRIAREIVDVVSAIREHAAIAVEENRCGRRRDDVFETALGFSAVAISDQSSRTQLLKRRAERWNCRGPDAGAGCARTKVFSLGSRAGRDRDRSYVSWERERRGREAVDGELAERGINSGLPGAVMTDKPSLRAC
jgi:hypothetical protein